MTPARRARLFLVLGLGLLLAAGGRHAGLVARRGADQLQHVPPEETTPLVAVTTVAFGAFRGLVANALWVRAGELQEQGQFFELVQMAAWISQLEPNVPEVWEFQAWNLAYNISVLFTHPEDRWRWISHGMDLLRSDGLRNNPTSPLLHWNIGWMFQHKVGMDMDQAHFHYKTELARQAEAAFAHPDGLEEVRRVFQMRPEQIRALEEAFGPLDWRLPSTHALYWSTRGLRHAGRDAFRARNLQRMRLQSLADQLRQGVLLTDSDGIPLVGLPRFDLLDRALAEVDRLAADPAFADLATRSLISFLNEATVLFAEYGRAAETLALYERLTGLDPDLETGQEGLFEMLAERGIPQDPALLSREQALVRLSALLTQAMELEESDPGRARGYRSLARGIHRHYQSTRRPGEHFERTRLPAFEDLVLALQRHQPLPPP